MKEIGMVLRLRGWNHRLISYGRRRQKKLILAGITVLGVAGLGVYILQASKAATVKTFAPNSFWYQPIPNDAPRHPNSSGMVNEVVRQMKTYYGSDNLMSVKLNTYDYSAPVYTAGPNDPRFNVEFYNCQNKDMANDTIAQKVRDDYFRNVPIPVGAAPAPGSDKEMVIYSPSENKMWEFWIMEQTGSGFRACWGGRMDNVSQKPGIWDWPYGTTASGLPLTGGQVTVAELQAGQIDHVVGIALPEPRKWDVVSWPANRSDGFSTNTNAPPEGQRFRLDPSVNVDALNIHPVAKTIAKAAQKYGLVVWDKAGATTLRAENPTSFTIRGQADPYKALFGTAADWNVLNGIPWDKLIALPQDYGKNIATIPPPTPTPSTPTPTPSPTPTGQISQTGNLATGKTFVASAAESYGTPPSYVNDSDESTRWISVPQDNTTLSTDLGASYTLKKVSVLWAGDTVKNYDIQVSADNTTWKTVASGTTNNTQKQLIDTTSFTSTPTGRYFRVLAKDRWNATYGNSVWEIGLYGAAATTPTPPPPTTSPTPGNGDANGDGKVNAIDYSMLASNDGKSYPPADFNKDGTVGAADLAILLSRWTW